MSDQFYDQFDGFVTRIIESLNNCDPNFRGAFGEYARKEFESLFYGSLINIFFLNLNTENLRECGLSSDYVEKIKFRFKKTQLVVQAALSGQSSAPLIDEAFYERFKADVKRDIPNAFELISIIEREVDIKRAKKYLDDKAGEIIKAGYCGHNLNSILLAGALLAFIADKGCLPEDEDWDKLLNDLLEALPAISEDAVNRLRGGAIEMLEQQRESQRGFEERLCERWQEPIDSLEEVIGLSMVYGENHKNRRLAKFVNENNSAKFAALIRIHQRALQISNEILTLSKAGYADGALARWRTLFELAVISFFLKDNDNEVSERYLDHERVRRYKDAFAYQRYCEELGETPFEKEEFDLIKEERQKALDKHADGFGKGDWDWIPEAKLKGQKFTQQRFSALVENVGFDRWIPFYNFASAALHGLSRGFHRLGLLANSQDTPLCGASNVGLADPLQNTAIFLNNVTVCLLTLEPDFESLMDLHVIGSFVDGIGEKAVAAQKAIEEES